MANEEPRNWAIRQLQDKANELGTAPKKADFDEATRARIKAFLGPWPRALEAAGLKEPKVRRAKSNVLLFYSFLFSNLSLKLIYINRPLRAVR